jgi:hypothetical protein
MGDFQADFPENLRKMLKNQQKIGRNPEILGKIGNSWDQRRPPGLVSWYHICYIFRPGMLVSWPPVGVGVL